METKLYTLQEVIQSLTNYDVKIYDVPTILAVLKNNFENEISISKLEAKPAFQSNLVNDLWDRVYATFYNYNVCFCFEKDFTAYAFNFFNRIVTRILNSFDYYSTLLNLYKENESKLLDKVSVITNASTRYNDTPATPQDFSGEGYTSDITYASSSSSSDLKPIIERLNDVRNLYKDLMAEWVLSFRKLFIERGGDR